MTDKEKAFYSTPIGAAFSKFKRAHSNYWAVDGQEGTSDKRLRQLSEASDAAEKELRELLEKVA